MAAVTTNTVRLTLSYEDGGTRSYTFDEVSDEALESVKAKALALNTEIADSASSIGAAMKATFVNDNDEDNTLSPVTAITGLTVTTTTSEVIFGG